MLYRFEIEYRAGSLGRYDRPSRLTRPNYLLRAVHRVRFGRIRTLTWTAEAATSNERHAQHVKAKADLCAAHPDSRWREVLCTATPLPEGQ